MTKSQKSSRKRMDSRNRPRGKKQRPAFAEVEKKRHGYVVGKEKVPNRAAKRAHQARVRTAEGWSHRQKLKDQRRIRVQKLRKAIAPIQRAARRVLRSHLRHP